jgi:hypothetical protein
MWLILFASSVFGLVDFSTLSGKHMVGYQGWFGCPGDGLNPNSTYRHWIKGVNSTDLEFDYWPETSEINPNDLCELPGYKTPDGLPAKVYSAHNLNVVNKHFSWMKNYNIDGVFIQNFFAGMKTSSKISSRLQVTRNVRSAAEKYGRAWSIMFDISGESENDISSSFQNIWSRFADDVKESQNYLKENGKPVVAVWGIGYDNPQHPIGPQNALNIIKFLKSEGLYVVGGVPHDWRKRIQNNPAWEAVYSSMDAISPWNVGRYRFNNVQSLKDNSILDKQQLDAWNMKYLPVIYPGFSWFNLKEGKMNDYPRYAGKMYFELAKAALASNPDCLYTAMFDEVNEGTQIFKVVSKKEDLPTPGNFNYLDIDGTKVPSDWYLTLAGLFTSVMHGEKEMPSSVPLP